MREQNHETNRTQQPKAEQPNLQKHFAAEPAQLQDWFARGYPPLAKSVWANWNRPLTPCYSGMCDRLHCITLGEIMWEHMESYED